MTRIEMITTVRPDEGSYTRYQTCDGQTFTGHPGAFAGTDHHYDSDEAAFSAAEAHAKTLQASTGSLPQSLPFIPGGK
jgi:hypothetical protein